MPFNSLTAISSVDGRYRAQTEAIAGYLSEYALIKNRVRVECEYLIALSETKGVGVRRLSSKEKKLVQALAADFSLKDAELIKKIEKKGYKNIPATNHDVKAVEYFLKLRLENTSLNDVREWIHFALTSEDVNSTAYALMLKEVLDHVFQQVFCDINEKLRTLAKNHARDAMLARTHGQSATPTTFGKEMRVFAERLTRQCGIVASHVILAKWGGASGGWNAHTVAAPTVDWILFSKKFIERFNDKTGVRVALNPVTTQIEPHDTYAELFDAFRRINTILIDFSQDMWRYVSDGWVIQQPKKGEVGSSAMPHKVNPIDFENAEGNLGIANALFDHFSRKLPISRLQRDLSDSTVERVFGVAFAHSLIAYTSLIKGLGKISVNTEALTRALVAHPEVLAEALQTVLRREGVAVPYEKLKEMTRGKQVTLEDFARFIDELSVSNEVKNRLKKLRPENYIGLSEKVAKED